MDASEIPKDTIQSPLFHPLSNAHSAERFPVRKPQCSILTSPCSRSAPPHHVRTPQAHPTPPAAPPHVRESDTWCPAPPQDAAKPAPAKPKAKKSINPKPFANPDKTPPPRSFRMCVEQAYVSTKAAIDAGYTLLEVPPRDLVFVADRFYIVYRPVF